MYVAYYTIDLQTPNDSKKKCRHVKRMCVICFAWIEHKPDSWNRNGAADEEDLSWEGLTWSLATHPDQMLKQKWLDFWKLL